MHAAEFLSAIFAGLDRGWIVLWRADNKQSEWLPHDRIDTCQAIVERCRGTPKADLYYGVGVQRQLLGTDRRGDESGVIAIPGVWADVDLGEASGLKKSKKKYPPREAAVQALGSMPLAPSCIVNSGGGFHCYWLFNELLETESAEGRERAKGIVAGWQSLLASRLASAGEWELDRVHDLSRVLRPVGSWNYRYGRSVELHAGGETDEWGRYAVSDMEQFLPVDGVGVHVQPDRPVYTCGHLTFDPGANPPLEKYNVLRINVPEFGRTFDHTGKEYPSNSEREAALTRYAVDALWSDQEIANLLIAHRRQFEPEKIGKLTERRDYIPRAIALVRGDSNRDQAIRELNGCGEPTAPAVVPPEDVRPSPGDGKPSSKQETLDKLSAAFGVKVEGWIQFGKEKPIYTLVLAGGRQVKIGTASTIIKGCQAFQSALYSETGHFMDRIAPKAWRGVCTSLASICEVIDGEDAETVEMIRAGLESFLANRDLYTADKKEVACALDASFISDGFAYVRINVARRYINFQTGDRWSQHEMLNAMRALGFSRQTIGYKDQEMRTTKRYWAGPLSLFPSVCALSL